MVGTLPPTDGSYRVSSYGSNQGQIIVGPSGPFPIDVVVAEPTDSDRVNNVRRLKVTLSDGGIFYGTPMPVQDLEKLGVDTSSFVNSSKFDRSVKSVTEKIFDIAISLEGKADRGSLGDYALKKDVPVMDNLVTRDDLESKGYLPVGTWAMFPGHEAPMYWAKQDGAKFDMQVYPELADRYPDGVLPSRMQYSVVGAIPIIYMGYPRHNSSPQ